MVKKATIDSRLSGYLTIIYKSVRFNLGTKLIFLVLSIILWFNINLQKEFETTISIPITISNIPKGKTLLNPIASEALVKIRSKGRSLLISDFNNDIFLEIDASGITDPINVRLTSDIFVNTSDNDIIPITVFHPQEVLIQFDKFAEKKVPVIVKSFITPAPGYLYTGKFIINPDSVTVSGPLTKLELIKSVNSKEDVERNLTTDYSKKINLILNDTTSIKYSHKKVGVFQQIVKKGITSFKIPVKLINKSGITNILIDPIAIDISVTGPVNELHNITADNFIVTADAGELDNITKKIPVKVKTETHLEWSSSANEVRAIQY